MSEQTFHPDDAAKLAAIAGVLPAKIVSRAKGAIPDNAIHHVELACNVRAVVKKSGPTEAKPTASLLSAASVAFLAKRLGATRAKVEKALAELAETAIANGGKVGDSLVADDDELLVTMHRFSQHVTNALPKVERPGRVTVSGSVQVDDLPLIQANEPKPEIELVDPSAELTINAADADGQTVTQPTFSMVAYNGGLLRLSGFPAPIVVDLDGLQIRSQSRPARLNHDANRGVGHTTTIKRAGNTLNVEGVISRQTDAATEVIASAKSGFPWQASIGAKPLKMERIAAGQTVRVNGQTFTGPIIIARESILGEVSFVDLGADDTTSARIAAADDDASGKGVAGEDTGADTPKNDTSEKGNLTMNFDQWLKAKGFDTNTITAEQRSTLEAAWKAETGNGEHQPVNASGAGDIDDVLNQAANEQQRRERIQAAAENVLKDRPHLHKEVGKIVTSAIEAGWESQKVELELMRLNRGNGGIGVRRDRGRDPRMIEAALCLAGGLSNVEKVFDEQTLNAADDQFGRGLGLTETMVMFAQQNGYRGHGTSQLRSMLQCAFAGEIQAAGGDASTFSLPGILSNVANKFLREGFDNVESTWRQIAATRSVRDFKQHTSYSLTGDFVYEQVGPDGELKHGKVGEEKYTNQAETYGRMFGISRQDIINDDLDALTAVPRRIGRGGAIKLNLVFWAEFLDNSAFFAAGNNNFKDGADTALGIDALTIAEQMFLDQTDPDGNPMGTVPQILLVPNGLNARASNLMQSTEVRPGGNNAKKQQETGNPHAGKFDVVRSSYLSNANLTGNSALAWYLLANPNDVPVIEVAFLQGRQEPTVESADADFNTLGVQMRGFHDFGVKKQEPRGGVKMKGEA